MGCHTWSNVMVKRPSITKKQFIDYHDRILKNTNKEIDECNTYEDLDDKCLLGCMVGQYDEYDKNDINLIKSVVRSEWKDWYQFCIRSWKIGPEKKSDNSYCIADVQSNIEGLGFDDEYKGVYKGYLYRYGDDGDNLGRIYGYPERKPIRSYKAFVRYYIKCWKYGDSESCYEGSSLGWTNEKPTKEMFNNVRRLFRRYGKGKVFITIG